MSSLWSRLKNLILVIFRIRRASSPPDFSPVQAVELQRPETDGMAERKADDAAILATLPNRAERRKYERARRRHDKWVTPRGPAPVKQKRERRPRTPAPVVTVAPAGSKEDLLIDRHHADGEKVLYEPSETWGQFNFRDTVLDQLDRYFIYLRRMRRGDPQSFAFYKQVGITLVPYARHARTWDYREEMKILMTKHDDDWSNRKLHGPEFLPPCFLAERPTFGCVAYGADPLTEEVELAPKNDPQKRSLWIPKFMYFVKYDHPPSELQPTSGGDVYKLTVYWDRPHDKKTAKHDGGPQEYGIFVSNDGRTVRALKTLDSKGRHKRGSAERGDWHLPGTLEKWAKGHKINPQNFLTDMFVTAVDDCMTINASIIRVNVEKDGMTAVFGVDARRMSYFFKDRDVTLTVAGAKKRIFHIVRPHSRSNGSVVKMHFRGLREFTWAGYKVLITVPGLHHVVLSEFNVGWDDEEWIEDKGNAMDSGEMGKRLRRVIETGNIKELARDPASKSGL